MFILPTTVQASQCYYQTCSVAMRRVARKRLTPTPIPRLTLAIPALNPRYSRAEIPLMSAPASRRADTTWPPSVIDRGHTRLPVCRNKSLFSQNDECTGAIKKNIDRLVKTAIEDY